MLTPSSPPREAASRPACAIFKSPGCHLRVIYVMIAASDNQQSLVWKGAVKMEAEVISRNPWALVTASMWGRQPMERAPGCWPRSAVNHLVWNRPHPAWLVFSWNSPPRGLCCCMDACSWSLPFLLATGSNLSWSYTKPCYWVFLPPRWVLLFGYPWPNYFNSVFLGVLICPLSELNLLTCLGTVPWKP